MSVAIAEEIARKLGGPSVLGMLVRSQADLALAVRNRLCVLEKLVHIEDPAILPELVMVTYEIPDAVSVQEVGLADLPADWRQLEALTQEAGDTWHESLSALLLRVPSAVVPIAGSPDLNVLINHRHAQVGSVRIVSEEPFALDPRLL